MYSCNNNRRGTGWFEGYQSFWIIVVIAIVIIWVHYSVGGNNGCDPCCIGNGHNDGCCGNGNNDCCCNPCCC